MTAASPLPDSVVLAAFIAGQRAWPGTSLPLPAFAEHLAKLEVDAAALANSGADLYIAAACAAGDPLAIARFDAQYLARIDSYVSRLRLPSESLAELGQQVRMALLVGNAPLIRGYRGSGPLRAWVRVIVVRTALHMTRNERAARANVDALAFEQLIASDLRPDDIVLKDRYRERLQLALAEALSNLNDEDKTLLRLNVIDGLSIDAIGRIYQVHRATAARWLVRLRRQLLEQVRQALALSRPASSSELRSLLRLLQGEIDISLRRLLE